MVLRYNGLASAHPSPLVSGSGVWGPRVAPLLGVRVCVGWACVWAGLSSGSWVLSKRPLQLSRSACSVEACQQDLRDAVETLGAARRATGWRSSVPVTRSCSRSPPWKSRFLSAAALSDTAARQRGGCAAAAVGDVQSGGGIVAPPSEPRVCAGHALAPPMLRFPAGTVIGPLLIFATLLWRRHTVAAHGASVELKGVCAGHALAPPMLRLPAGRLTLRGANARSLS